MYYILSLKHTKTRDKYMTLWRPNNAGYCYSKENAGLYEKLSSGYENGSILLLIHEELANKVFIPYKNDPDASDPYLPTGSLIPNTAKNRKLLGVQFVNGSMELINPLPCASV